MLRGLLKVVFAGVAVGTVALIAATPLKEPNLFDPIAEEGEERAEKEEEEHEEELENAVETTEQKETQQTEQLNIHEDQAQGETRQVVEEWHSVQPTVSGGQHVIIHAVHAVGDSRAVTRQETHRLMSRELSSSFSDGQLNQDRPRPEQEEENSIPPTGDAQLQESVDPKCEEWTKAKDDGMAPNGLSILSADMGISMWKIYYDFCCKMNDLQETFFSDNSSSEYSTSVLKQRHQLTGSLIAMSSPEDCMSTFESDISSELSTNIHRASNQTDLVSADSFKVEHCLSRDRMRRTRPKRRSFKGKSRSLEDNLLRRKHHDSVPSGSRECAKSFVTCQSHRRAIYESSGSQKKRIKYTRCQSDCGDRAALSRSNRQSHVNPEMLRMCIQQIWSVWTRRKMESFVLRRVALRRGLKAFKMNHDRVRLNKRLAQCQAVWRGYHFRTQSLPKVTQDLKLTRLAQFVNWQMIARSFLRALARNRLVRVKARRRICQEVETWFVRHKTQMELLRKKEKRRKWLRMRQRKEEQLKRKMQRSLALVDVDDLVLTVELRRWISLVMKQIDVHSRDVPSTNDFIHRCPRLDGIWLGQTHRNDSNLQQEMRQRIARTCPFGSQSIKPDNNVSVNAKQFSSQHLLLQTWMKRCVVRHRLKRAFQLTKERMVLASMIIQVAIKCRFAVMLLTAKSKYLSGITRCEMLIRLGVQTRAAILIQAAWRYSRSSSLWKRYIFICKLRLAVLSNLSRRCTQAIEDRRLGHMVEQFRTRLLEARATRRVSDKLDTAAIREFLAVLPTNDSAGFSSSCA